jgi:hypothetical protein
MESGMPTRVDNNNNGSLVCGLQTIADPALSALLASALADQAKNEVATISNFVSKALGDWTGNVLAKWKIQRAVSNRRVLGSNSDLKRKDYAMSPILSILDNHCLKAPGFVFVAYGRGGAGKTTSLHAVMGRYAERGVALSPGEVVGSYKDVMLNRIGLNADNPPTGWLEKFLEELEAPSTEKPAVLMLDDFMNDRSEDVLDKALLMNIKLSIRGKNIVAIVLTTKKESANKMINWNTTIVPAATEADIERYKEEKERADEAGETFEFDWNENSRLKWTTPELKKAVLALPKYVDYTQDQKDDLISKIDAKISNTSSRTRESLNPTHLLLHLANQEPDRDVLQSPKDGWGSNGWNCAFNF